jgi:hypothetical protein
MILGPSGETLFFKRRHDGLDSLYAMQPDGPSADEPVLVTASPHVLRFWLAGNALVVAAPWPRAPGGLSLRAFDVARIADALRRRVDLNARLTDVALAEDFTLAPAPIPEAVFALLQGESLAVPGMAPHAGAAQDQAPAAYMLDARSASMRVLPLPFMDPHALPNELIAESGTDRRWLTIGDSHHLFVLRGPECALAGDVLWPAEQRGLARVAFHPTRPEAWVTAVSSVFIVDRLKQQVVGEIAVEPELRWQRGERMAAAAGSVVFAPDGQAAWIARPYSGDVLEIDARTVKPRRKIPLAVDALELAMGHGRVFAQGLRNGAVSWFPA